MIGTRALTGMRGGLGAAVTGASGLVRSVAWSGDIRIVTDRGGRVSHRRTENAMKRAIAFAICGLSLAGCSSMPGWMQFDAPRSTPAATTMQFESQPAGAEARTSTGQTCLTPCSVAVAADEFTVTFTSPGYLPQTVPVRRSTGEEGRDPNAGLFDGPRLAPNPVTVELTRAAPVAPPRRRPSVKKPKPAVAATGSEPAAPRPTKTTARAPAAAPASTAPAPAPAAAWPPVPATR